MEIRTIIRKFANIENLEDFINKFSREHKIIKREIKIIQTSMNYVFSYVIIDYEG